MKPHKDNVIFNYERKIFKLEQEIKTYKIVFKGLVFLFIILLILVFAQNMGINTGDPNCTNPANC